MSGFCTSFLRTTISLSLVLTASSVALAVQSLAGGASSGLSACAADKKGCARAANAPKPSFDAEANGEDPDANAENVLGFAGASAVGGADAPLAAASGAGALGAAAPEAGVGLAPATSVSAPPSSFVLESSSWASAAFAASVGGAAAGAAAFVTGAGAGAAGGTASCGGSSAAPLFSATDDSSAAASEAAPAARSGAAAVVGSSTGGSALAPLRFFCGASASVTSGTSSASSDALRSRLRTNVAGAPAAWVERSLTSSAMMASVEPSNAAPPQEPRVTWAKTQCIAPPGPRLDVDDLGWAERARLKATPRVSTHSSPVRCNILVHRCHLLLRIFMQRRKRTTRTSRCSTCWRNTMRLSQNIISCCTQRCPRQRRSLMAPTAARSSAWASTI